MVRNWSLKRRKRRSWSDGAGAPGWLHLRAGDVGQLADGAFPSLIPQFPIGLRRRHVGDCSDLVEGQVAGAQ